MLEVMRDILQSRYLRGNVAHKQLARTSLMNQNAAFCILVKTTPKDNYLMGHTPLQVLEIWEWLFQLVIPFVGKNNYEE